jgi:putative phosphoribosyl transferase
MLFDIIRLKFRLRFRTRETAAHILAESLKESLTEERRKDAVVLGIPRGGVVLASIIATKLGCKFDIIVPMRLSSPLDIETTIGATMEDGTTYLNEEAINRFLVSKPYLEKEKNRQIWEIRRRNSLYREGRGTVQVKNRTLILVDDGAASGSTLIAAARWLKRQTDLPQYLLIAIPVAPRSTVNLLRKEVNHVEAITIPADSIFRSVEQYYHNFEPVSDERVVKIMKNTD